MVIVIVTMDALGTNPIHRMTEQRRLILEEVGKTKSHPTASEVYEAVRRHLPQISLGTVYRNLNVLARGGAITKVMASEAPCRFDADVTAHCHVTCTACGRMDDVTDFSGKPFIDEPPKHLSGYEVIGYRLEFMGVCPECQRKRNQKGVGHG